MSLYDDASLIAYPSGYKESKIYAQKPVPSYGAELVNNGDFATDTGWNKNANWSISGGVAIADGTGSSDMNQGPPFASVGTKYLISFDVVSLSQGSFRVWFGNATIDGDTVGSFSGEVIATSTDRIRILAISTAIGSIDNVSVKEVLNNGDLTFTRASSATRVNAEGLIETASILGSEEVTNGDFATDTGWNKGTGWTISGGTFNAGDTTSVTISTQGSVLVIGKSYKITYSISNWSGTLTAGLSQSVFDFHNAGYISGNGVYTFYGIATSTLIAFFSRAENTFSIDNVSVKEVITSNIPRIDYSNGCGSLLLEGQRTNLIPYSEDFSNAAWNKNNLTVTSDSAISPDGTLNAAKLTEGSGTSTQYRSNISISASSAIHTFTCYVKRISGTRTAYLDLGAVTGFFNFDTETMHSTSGVGTFENFGDGWYRIRLSHITASTAACFLGFGNGNTETYTSTGGAEILFWGIQIEQSSYPTSYVISNSGTTTTRLADTSSTTGLSSVINSTEGVLYAELSALADGTNQRWISLGSGSNANRVSILFNTASKINCSVRGSAAAIYDANFNIGSQTNNSKVAVRYKDSDFAFFVNGVKVDSQLSGSLVFSSPLSQLSFDSADAASVFEGNVQNLMVFPSALTDDELADLTGAVHQTFNSLATFYGYTIL